MVRSSRTRPWTETRAADGADAGRGGVIFLYWADARLSTLTCRATATSPCGAATTDHVDCAFREKIYGVLSHLSSFDIHAASCELRPEGSRAGCDFHQRRHL